MVKRALVCGLGESYKETGILPALPLTHDLDSISHRLLISDLTSIDKWASIDLIDDSPTSIFDDATNNLVLSHELMPTKENIFNSINEITALETDIFLFYFSGHGLRVGKFYMAVYDKDFFQQAKTADDLADPPDDKLITDEQYINLINDKLDRNPQLLVISIIDCCFSGSVIKTFQSINQNPERHIIFCAVGVRDKARGNGFTNNLCQSAASMNTYMELKNDVLQNSGSPIPNIYIPDLLKNINKHF